MLKLALKVDFFRVVQDRDQHLTPATQRGGYLSVICVALIVLGFLNESYLYLRSDMRSTMAVSKHALAMEPVHFNVTFHNFPCYAMTVEMIDPSTARVYEEQQKTLHLRRIRLHEAGRTPVGEYHDGEGNKGFDGEGCRLEGDFSIDKVPGNFIMTANRWNRPQQELPSTDFTIHELWFGVVRISEKDIDEHLANALAGVSRKGEPPQTLYQFFLSIVPTSFYDGRLGFQYTAIHNSVQAPIAPGLYFRHAHSPLSVMYEPSPLTFSHYVTNLCAVIGGVFTVVGLGVRATGKVAALLEARRKDNA